MRLKFRSKELARWKLGIFLRKQYVMLHFTLCMLPLLVVTDGAVLLKKANSFKCLHDPSWSPAAMANKWMIITSNLIDTALVSCLKSKMKVGGRNFSSTFKDLPMNVRKDSDILQWWQVCFTCSQPLVLLHILTDSRIMWWLPNIQACLLLTFSPRQASSVACGSSFPLVGNCN